MLVPNRDSLEGSGGDLHKLPHLLLQPLGLWAAEVFRNQDVG